MTIIQEDKKMKLTEHLKEQFAVLREDEISNHYKSRLLGDIFQNLIIEAKSWGLNLTIVKPSYSRGADPFSIYLRDPDTGEQWQWNCRYEDSPVAINLEIACEDVYHAIQVREAQYE